MFKKFYTIKSICGFLVLIAIFCWIYPYLIHRGNNYKIFIGTYNHLLGELNLYSSYPKEYDDVNHYGPLFGVLIAPFAKLPYFWGGLLWNVFNALALCFSILKLPIGEKEKKFVLLLSSVAFAHSQYEMQSNSLITALIILSFVYINKNRETLAAFFIVFGFLIKIYPIVAVAFAVFSPNKLRFTISFLIWLIILLLLPCIATNPHFVFQSYIDWINILVQKNGENVQLSSDQDYSIMGLARQMFHDSTISNLPFLIFGALIFGAGLIRFPKFLTSTDTTEYSLKSKIYILASALLTVVIFSTGSESQTFIIAVTGCFLYLSIQDTPFSKANVLLIILIIVIDGLAPTDLFPKPVREIMLTKMVMMVWPCALIWIKISLELILENIRLWPAWSQEEVA